MPSVDLADLHPDLLHAFNLVVAAYPQQQPGHTLRVTCTHRTVAEQQKAFAAGTSRADGVHTFSLHQWYPAVAVDIVVIDADGKGVYAPWDLYESYGVLGEAQGLTWGGRWSRLRDGPHLELSEKTLIRVAQGQLNDRGFECGTPDGIAGKHTHAALLEAQGRYRLPQTGVLDRDTWAQLHDIDPKRIL